MSVLGLAKEREIRNVESRMLQPSPLWIFTYNHNTHTHTHYSVVSPMGEAAAVSQSST